MIVGMLHLGKTSSIVSDVVAKNPALFAEYLKKEKIDLLFLTASLIKTFASLLGHSLKAVYLCSERVSDAYSSKFDIWNVYGNTETMSSLSAFVIDKPYPNTPIGRDCGYTKMFLYDNGVESETEGEICLELPYFRGYLNQETETAKAFVTVNGKKYFRTGDIARRDKDGLLYVLGRADDMVKINGNRVEPAEIEAALKKVLGTNIVAVKAFDKLGKKILCAYYQKETVADQTEVVAALGRLLPTYMIPSFFVRLDSMPLNRNGKIDKPLLKLPEIAMIQAGYASPQTETEKKLCELFKKVLSENREIERIGLDDDFFLLGGDSLLTMRLLADSGLNGLTLESIYDGRTPRRIAELYENSVREKKALDADVNTLMLPHELSYEQIDILKYEAYLPNTTMHNLPALVKISGVIPEKLAVALSKVIRNHPALLTKYFKDKDGVVRQVYSPDLMTDVVVEKVSDEDLEKIKEALVQPFALTEHLLYRCRVFDSPSGVYLFLDFHHAQFDGLSGALFLNNLQKALDGIPLAPDCYYDIIANREAVRNSTRFTEGKAYFENRYKGTTWESKLRYDYDNPKNLKGSLEMPFSRSENAYEITKDATGLSRNGIYITAGLLALAAMNRSKNVMVTWFFNGRKSPESLNSVGAHFYEFPAALKITESLTMGEVFADIYDQLEKAVEHSAYPYVSMEFPNVVEGDTVCIYYQYGLPDFDGDWKYPMEEVEIDSHFDAALNALDVAIYDSKDGTTLALDYEASLYKKESVECFGKLMGAFAKEIMENKNLANKLVTEFIDERFPG